jgi:hypothetical protein
MSGLGHRRLLESSTGCFGDRCLFLPREAGLVASGGGCELVRDFQCGTAGLKGGLPGLLSCRRWQSTAAYRLKSSENHNI